MNIKLLAVCLCSLFLCGACIQSEALNSEAAIDGCSGKNVQKSDIDADAKVIYIHVDKSADLSRQELLFQLPEGATISPDQAETADAPPSYDFSRFTRSFTVTSEDKKVQSTYTIHVMLPVDLPSLFRFEELQSNPNYHILYIDKENSNLTWASGNPGYELTFMAKEPTDYPTVQVGDGYQGKAVKLETRSTGSFGAMVKMYIAAGNLFIGTFDLANALKDPRKATNFGLQFYKHPQTLKGRYKYKAGPVYTESGKPQPGLKDRCDIYAIMYEADEVSFMLNGENALTSDKLVSVARLNPADIVEGDEWSTFSLPFELRTGKTIDSKKLIAGKYKLAIVLSSSVDGAYFKGAVGSALYVDELELICKED